MHLYDLFLIVPGKNIFLLLTSLFFLNPQKVVSNIYLSFKAAAVQNPGYILNWVIYRFCFYNNLSSLLKHCLYSLQKQQKSCWGPWLPTIWHFCPQWHKVWGCALTAACALQPGELGRLLDLLRATETLTEQQLAGLSILMSDFQDALVRVQPSAKREGFATVPDVTWENVGALQNIREELTMSILVKCNRTSTEPYELLQFVVL